MECPSEDTYSAAHILPHILGSRQALGKAASNTHISFEDSGRVAVGIRAGGLDAQQLWSSVGSSPDDAPCELPVQGGPWSVPQGLDLPAHAKIPNLHDQPVSHEDVGGFEVSVQHGRPPRVEMEHPSYNGPAMRKMGA